MKKCILIFLTVLAIGLLLALALAWRNMRDRHPDYALDVRLYHETNDPVALQVGLSRCTITPDLPDTWIDADSNALYEPDQGDRFIDGNGNKKFDAIWLAGFDNNRPARSVHDDLWARAILLDDGKYCVALVAIDAIGFYHDDVIDVRTAIAAQSWKIDHVIICSTHNHETPDLMGLWGPSSYQSGINADYLRYVKNRIVQAIGDAYVQRRPAHILAARIDATAPDLVRDSRLPRVLDDAIHLLKFRTTANDSLLGMLMNWGDHPETLAGDNLDITADFCHYWLQGIETGIICRDQVIRAGVGGIAVFVNGCIGGLMTTLGCEVYDPWLNAHFKKASFNKARSQGYRLADLVLDKIQNGPWEKIDNPQINLVAKTVLLPVSNRLFKLGAALRVLDRGFIGWNKIRSEVNALTLGQTVAMLFLPGEIYPEIVNGGIEMPAGSDLAGPVVETPPLRQLMPGTYKFVIGLANDEVGYVIPKTQWDEIKPYTYDAKKALYGEINSCGPEVGPTLYHTAKQIMERIKR